MNWKLKTILGVAAFALTTQAMAQITFYEHEGFRGRTFSASRQVNNFMRFGFNDLASSVVVDSGRWEVCDDEQFEGRCVVLRRGSYESLSQLGMNDRISSVRPVSQSTQYEQDNDSSNWPEPLPTPTYDYRRRPNERLREATVTSVRAVVGPPEQRCWVEREQVSNDRGDRNIGGAIAGALIGGILGHQVGNGRGNDVATAVGALAGGTVGSNVGRNGGNSERDVQRCNTVASTTPAYWDVTYNYRGRTHRAQMSSPPGRTILVNPNGEPRL